MRRGAAEETREIIAAEGGDATSFTADVSKAEDVKSLVDECVKTYGRIDVLLNNVGVLAVGGPEETSEEIWDRHLAVNVKSVFLSCKYALPILIRQCTSAIVNISSIASIRYTGYPSVAYNAFKGALNQLTQNIAIQYAAKGVRANCVLPGLMNTPMIRTPLENVWARWSRRDDSSPGRAGPDGENGRRMGCGVRCAIPGFRRGEVYYRHLAGCRWWFDLQVFVGNCFHHQEVQRSNMFSYSLRHLQGNSKLFKTFFAMHKPVGRSLRVWRGDVQEQYELATRARR